MPNLIAGILSTVGDFTLIIGIGLILLGFLFFFLARIIFWITLAAGVLLALAVAFILNAFVEPLFHIPEICYAGLIIGIIIASLIYAIIAQIMAMVNGVVSIGAGYAMIFGYNFALMGGMPFSTCSTLWIIATIVTCVFAYLVAANLPSSAIALVKRGVDLKEAARREKVKVERKPEVLAREQAEEPTYYYCTKCEKRHKRTSGIGIKHTSWREGAPPRAEEWICPRCGKRLGLRVVLSHLADKHPISKKVRCVNCSIELPGFVSTCPFCEDRTRKVEIEEPFEPKLQREEVVEEPSEVVFCIKCGNKLDSDSRFCVKCGAEVKEE